MENKELLTEKDLIISQIKKYVPLFAPFLEVNSSVREYSDRLSNFSVNSAHSYRQALVKKVISEKFNELFGKDDYNKLVVDLDGKLMFNIADHHQVLNHPFLISSNVISSVDKYLQNTKQPAIVVVSSGDVPPNNFFSKNGFKFHDIIVPLFSVREREHTSYYLTKRDFNFRARLKEVGRWTEFSKNEQEFLFNEEQRIHALDFSSCQDYNDQVSLIVKNTWPLMFEQKLRPNLPELLYITQEELTSRCLITLLEENNFISDCLFKKEFRNAVLENFRGIVVAWREQESKGTHFFWRKYPGQPRSLRMYVEGDQLVPADPRFKHLAVNLDKNTIIGLLKEKEIYPSLFLIFSVLNFYCGVKPLTGYGSTVYLQYFKDAWLKTLQQSGMEDEAALVELVDTTGFVAGLPVFFKRFGTKLRTLYAYDVIFEQGITEEYLQKVFKMPFNELLSVGLPELYAYFSQKYVPANEKFTPKVTIDDLAEQTFNYL